jgi:hypothetical protein
MRRRYVPRGRRKIEVSDCALIAHTAVVMRPVLEQAKAPVRVGLAGLAAGLAPELLSKQFVLGRSLPVSPAGWVESSAAGWRLLRDPALPLTPVQDASGRETGWLLGFPLQLGKGERKEALRVAGDATRSEFVRQFEDALYDHAGSYAAILLEPEARLYIDPYGSLPVHFDPELELASSSPFLLGTGEELADSAVAHKLDVVRTNLWHILGTSPLAGAARLVPNHALDLGAWAPTRIWPRAALPETDFDSALATAVDAISGSIAAASAAKGANISLTAGGDTRLLLAASGPVLDRLSFFTAELPDILGEIDRRTASRLAGRFGLSHRFLPWVSEERRDVELWLYRTGLTVGEARGRRAGPTYAQLDGSLPYISGVGGVLGVGARDFAARDGGVEKVTAEGLVRGFHFPLLDEFVAGAARWLEELPEGLDRVQTHVLFRCEMYYGCWGGPLALGYPESTRYALYPNAQRRVIESTLRLPLSYRISGRAGREAIRRLKPELLEIPINQPTVRLRFRRRKQRTVEQARAGFRKLAMLLSI